MPHLTVAEGEREVLDAAETAVRPFLPVRAEAREVVLLAETAPDGRRWEVLAAPPLASP